MSVTIKLRRDTAANWTSINPVLSAGEPGLETDTLKIKYGDGTHTWSNLSYGMNPNPSTVLDATAIRTIKSIAVAMSVALT